jgi:hypothetical protein
VLKTAWLHGEVAQSVEHTAENRGVAGSIPALAIGRDEAGEAGFFRSALLRARVARGAEPFNQGVDELALEQDAVGARFLDGFEELRRIVRG